VAWQGNNNEISVQLNVPSWIRGRDVSGKNFSSMAIVFGTKDMIEANRNKKKKCYFFTAMKQCYFTGKTYDCVKTFAILQIYLRNKNG